MKKTRVRLPTSSNNTRPLPDRARHDLAGLRQRLAGARGPDYWRSLEELAHTPEFRQRLELEFAPGADLAPDGVDRRRFLQVMGASMALAGVACTRQPLEHIVPYVKQPEEIIPGKPLYFASAHTMQGIATGTLVESHMGRPTKIEGNPDHPASLGATDRFAQAAILDLYDPDRSRVLKHLGRIRTWPAFDAEVGGILKSEEALGGAGLRILTSSTTSPTLGTQMRLLRQRFPQARWHQWDPVGRDALRSGTQVCLGEPVDIVYDFTKADVVLSLDADFLSEGAGHLRYARDFMARRRLRDGAQAMNRLYVAESQPTNTGAVADHRLPMSTTMLISYAMAIAFRCGVFGTSFSRFESGPLRQWMEVVADELRVAAGRSIVIAGQGAPPEVHAWVLACNAKLGNFGNTMFAIEALDVEPTNQLDSMRDLVRDMNAGQVDALVILGGNPVYDTPVDLQFATALEKVRWRAHLSLKEDETSEACHWHVPMSHELEAWSDARAYDGTVTVMQPLIEPLYGSRSQHEVLALLTGQNEKSGRDVVRAHWQAEHASADFETFWRRTLHDGWVEGTRRPVKSVTFNSKAVISFGNSVRSEESRAPEFDELFEVQFRADPNIHDGQFANNGWLQELPKPWTRLTWDNVAMLSPAAAERLEVQNEDVVEITVRDRTVRAPVWVTPGHPNTAITLHLGYGRRRAGRVGDGAGFDAYRLRTAAHLWSDTALKVTRTSDRLQLACTQDHFSMEGRDLVREATFAEYRDNPGFAQHGVHHAETSLYPDEHHYDGYAWAMAIDLGACTGCNACVVACNAENNIPVVGKSQVLNTREMHWLRIDRYFEGNLDNPHAVHQPMMCLHCELAPCEPVCPVGATVHSPEGLNEMVYNRCVGTRYCSNNCPYKVRRFNYFMYSDLKSESLKLMRNPDVSVRTRGVMEKCTYCVQRINRARIQAKKEERSIYDGEVVSACQQACPTEALVFGDRNDPNSKVSKLLHSQLAYSILEELNTRPRTAYLARVRNPQSALGDDSHGS